MTCTKRSYPDAATAKRVLDRLVQRWNDGTIEDPCFAKRAYQCPDCGSYHLTKQDARRFNPTDVYAEGFVPAFPGTTDDGHDAYKDARCEQGTWGYGRNGKSFRTTRSF